MILDILNNIKNYSSNIKNVLNICTIDRNTNENIYIINLYDFDKKILEKLTQKILEQKRYCKLKKLCIYNNRKINNLNHLEKFLQVLDCGLEYDINNIVRKLNNTADHMTTFCKYSFAKKRETFIKHIQQIMEYISCGIDSSGILKLNLHKLYCDNNPKITDIGHMKETLKVLSCCGISGVNQVSISILSLEKLMCDDNPKINDLNHMKNTLKILKCRKLSQYIPKTVGCMIGDDGISRLKLTKIYFGGNPYITDLNHMKETLQVLDIDGEYSFTEIRLSQKGISQLKLKEIYLSECIEEIDLSDMSDTLSTLKIYHYIDLSKLKLKCLHIAEGELKELRKNVSIVHMRDTLKVLTIHKAGYVNSDDISKLNLKYLILTDPDVKPDFSSLKKTIKLVKCTKQYYKQNKHRLCGIKVAIM